MVFRVERLQPEYLFLLSERGHHVLTGKAYYHLAPFLDGNYTIAEIGRELSNVVGFFELTNAIARLRKKGFVVDNTPALPDDLLQLCHILHIHTKNCFSQALHYPSSHYLSW